MPESESEETACEKACLWGLSGACSTNVRFKGSSSCGDP